MDSLMRWWHQEGQRSNGMHWAVGLWIAFTVAAAVKVLVQPTVHTVYPVFAHASWNWWQDCSLYEPSPDQDLYRYSPTFAVLMTPFAVWPHWLGGLFWLGSNVAILLAVLDRSAEQIFPGIGTPDQKGIWLILTLVGSARSLWAGQSNSLILAMAIGALLAIRGRRWWLAALLLAGGGFIKVWPWALALVAAACWPKQLVFRLAISVCFWAGIPFLTKPPDTVLWQYGQWLQMLHTTQIYRWGGYRDAWTIWELIHWPVPRDIYELVQCETALAVLAWCLWQRQQLRPEWLGQTEKEERPKDASDQAPAPKTFLGNQLSGQSAISGEPTAGQFSRMAAGLLSAWASWQLLFGPGTERLTYILVAPMVSWAVLASWQSGRYRALAVGAWILITMFSMGAVERLVVKITIWGRALLPVGVAVFAVWLVLHETVPGPIWRKSPFIRQNI